MAFALCFSLEYGVYCLLLLGVWPFILFPCRAKSKSRKDENMPLLRRVFLSYVGFDTLRLCVFSLDVLCFSIISSLFNNIRTHHAPHTTTRHCLYLLRDLQTTCMLSFSCPVSSSLKTGGPGAGNASFRERLEQERQMRAEARQARLEAKKAAKAAKARKQR